MGAVELSAATSILNEICNQNQNKSAFSRDNSLSAVWILEQTDHMTHSTGIAIFSAVLLTKVSYYIMLCSL